MTTKPTPKLSFLALIAACFLSAGLTASVETGQPAPDFTLTDTKGVEHQLSDFAGKVVVLEWTNHQCPFVVKHYADGHMQALQKKVTGEGDIWLQVVSSAEGKQGYVTADEGEALRNDKGIASTAMLLDPSGTVGKTYGARTTPHMFIVGPSGKVVYQGAIDSVKSTRTADIAEATNYVSAAYKNLKAGKAIEPSTTVAYGCGVKY